MPNLSTYHSEPDSHLGHTIYDNSGSALFRQGRVVPRSSLQMLESRRIKHLSADEPKVSCAKSEDLLPADMHRKANQLLNQAFRIVAEGGEKQVWEQNAADLDELVFELLTYFQDQPVSDLDLTQIKSINPTVVKHSINVGILAGLLAIHLGLSKERLHQVLKAGLLHDIGKVFVSPAILYKPGELSPEEVNEIEKHPGTGYRLLVERYSSSTTLGLGSLLHHERWNGSGYPYQLRGKEIHLYGRIIAVADVFDAMTSERVYRRGMSYISVLVYLEKQAGVYFDPKVIAAMQRIILPDLALDDMAFPPGGTPPRLSKAGPIFKNGSGPGQVFSGKGEQTKKIKRL